MPKWGLAMSFLLVSCTSETLELGVEAQGDAQVDAGDPDSGAEVVCCPVQVDFSCYKTGGAMRFGQCGGFCDCGPTAWRFETDAYGCMVAIPNGPPDCSGQIRDAGQSTDARR